MSTFPAAGLQVGAKLEIQHPHDGSALEVEVLQVHQGWSLVQDAQGRQLAWFHQTWEPDPAHQAALAAARSTEQAQAA